MCVFVCVCARARACVPARARLRPLFVYARACAHTRSPSLLLSYRVLPCVSESPVRINGLVLKHLNGRVSSIIVEISKHYKRQVTCDV